MDHYIRIGLFAAWGLFLLTTLIWWVRRRASKQYPYSERATVILEAIRQGMDIGIIYWSKSERKFLRRVVTPESLDGYAMRAVDHAKGEVRIFKVTRIRLINLIPPGAPRHPPSRMTLISWPTVAAFSLGGLALLLLAFALFRGQGPEQLTVGQPVMIAAPNQTEPRVLPPGSNSLKLAEHVTEEPSAVDPDVQLPVRRATPVDLVATDDFLNAPLPVPNTTNQTWYLIVESHPSYKINQVADVLQGVLRYRTERAIELEQSVRTLGRAVVWSGSKDRADRYRQFFENYDISAKIERAGSATTATNAAVTATNTARVSKP